MIETSKEYAILCIETQLAKDEEVLKKYILSYQNTDKVGYSLKELNKDISDISSILERKVIFVNDLTRLYCLYKELQEYKTYNTDTGISSVYTKHFVFKNLKKICGLYNNINAQIALNDSKWYVKYLIDFYKDPYEVPNTLSQHEKNILKEKLQNNEEWHKFVRGARVINNQMFEDYKKCKTAGISGICKREGKVIKDCYSLDIKSAYPAAMCSQLYPACVPIIIENPNLNLYKEKLQNKQYMVVFKAYNVIPVGCIELNRQFSIGTDLYKEPNEIAMTNDEFEIFRACYIYDKIEIKRLYIYNVSKEIPKVFREYLAYDLFGKKENTPKNSIEHDMAKTRLNLWFGNGLQFLSSDTLKQARAVNQFEIPPIIGLFTVGHIIKRIYRILSQIKSVDRVKYDVDSITFRNKDNMIYFQKDNELQEELIYRIYKDRNLAKSLGQFKEEWHDDIILWGRGQYGLLNSNKIKMAGAIQTDQTVSDVIETKCIKNGSIKYDIDNCKIIRNDYHIQPKGLRILKDAVKGL